MTDPTDFPCTITIRIPFPTHRHAHIALRSISIDPELSPLVQRAFTLTSPSDTTTTPPFPSDVPQVSPRTGGAMTLGAGDYALGSAPREELTVLVTAYRASTDRMLRVAVNGFLESVGVVIQCMRELDADVVESEWKGEGLDEVDELRRVQGLEEADTIG